MDDNLFIEATLEDDKMISGKYLGRVPSPRHGEVLMIDTPRGLYHIPVSMVAHMQTIRSATNPALQALRHHVTGAVERGEAEAIVEVLA